MFVRSKVVQGAMERSARCGDGWLGMIRRTDNSTDANSTITTAMILGGLYSRSGTNTSRTDTTDTAANILAAMPDMNIGDTYMFMVANLTGTNAVTIAGGTGVTASGNLSVLALTTKWFMLTKTSATAMTMVGL